MGSITTQHAPASTGLHDDTHDNVGCVWSPGVVWVVTSLCVVSVVCVVARWEKAVILVCGVAANERRPTRRGAAHTQRGRTVQYAVQLVACWLHRIPAMNPTREHLLDERPLVHVPALCKYSTAIAMSCAGFTLIGTGMALGCAAGAGGSITSCIVSIFDRTTAVRDAVNRFQCSQRGGRRVLALCFHGKVGGWRTRSKMEVDAKQMVSVAHFASDAVFQRIVEPNRRAGFEVEIFLHSWSPKAVGMKLDALYQPIASKHERCPFTAKVPCCVPHQHLSLKRVLTLMLRSSTGGGRCTNDLVLSLRYDLLFLSDLPVAGYSHSAVWMPQLCQDASMRPRQSDERALSALDDRALSDTCGTSLQNRHGMRRGLLAPISITQLYQRWRWQSLALSHATDHNMFVTDWFFVAPFAVAQSFTALYDRFGAYHRNISIDLARTNTQSQRLYEPFAHVYWAWHLTRVLRGVDVRFLPCMEGVDVVLARKLLEAACDVRAPQGLTKVIESRARSVMTPFDPFDVALASQAAGHAQLPLRRTLVNQCPDALWRGATPSVRCPIESRACRVTGPHYAAFRVLRAKYNRALRGLHSGNTSSRTRTRAREPAHAA